MDDSNLIKGRKCPKCGNEDWDDDFVIMLCSKCNNLYYPNQAEEVLM